MWTEGHFPGEAMPALGLYEEVEALLIAHPNWDFAGELLIGNYFYQTWRCIGPEDPVTGVPGNGFGTDFYVTIRYHEDGFTGNLLMGAFEEYDHSSGQVARACTNNTSSATSPDLDGSYGSGTLYPIQNQNNGGPYKHLISTSEIMDYWALVANDGIYIGSRIGTSDWGVWAGLFESLMDVDPFPLICCNILGTYTGTSTSSTYYSDRGYWSRHPNVSVSDFRILKAAYPGWAIWTRRSGQIANIGDPFHGGRVLGSRIVVKTDGVSDGDTQISTMGNIRGLFNHLLYFNVPAGVVVGDTILIDGDTYHFCGGGRHNWINRDAE